MPTPSLRAQTQTRSTTTTATATSDSPESTEGSASSPTRSSRLSRSYVTLLAAAAEEARGRGGGQGGAAGGLRGGAGAGGGEVSLAEEAVAREGKIRQLEAENLRLRFRVADLEGQVRGEAMIDFGVFCDCFFCAANVEQ